jgi:TrmH family RNA methyltransferase
METTDHELITSRKNSRIQRVKKILSSSSYRQSEKSFVIEGVRLVEEAIASGWTLRELYTSANLNQRGRSLAVDAVKTGCCWMEVSDEVMAEISDTETPQGIVAVLTFQILPLPEKLDFILILDAIRDPGNVGTILRTAGAAGVDAVLTASETADPFSPKVLRSGMGAQLKLPIRYCTWEEISAMIHAQAGMKTILADIGEGSVLWEVPLRQAIAIIISNEASGPSPAARDLADNIITIPMPGNCESLNAAIAASLLIYEVLRQRR